MLDVKIMRNDFERVEKALKDRGKSLELISGFAPLDGKRRELLQESESLKNRRNMVSAEVAKRKKNKENADELIIEMREVGDRIKELDDEVRALEAQIDELMLSIPNIPHADVPVGGSEEENVEVRRWSEPRQFDFTPKAHWDIATDLGILDFEAGAKVAGSRFTFIKGWGLVLSVR